LLYYCGALFFLRFDSEVVMKHMLMLAALALAAAGSALAQAPPAPQPALPGAPPCDTCGVVESVRHVEKQGQGSGVGLIAGGVVGGVLGNQIGSGRGNTAATIIGAGAGAYAGNQVEKNAKKTSYWVVHVKLDNGTHQSITSGAKPAFKQGDRVKVVDGKRLALITN
jgi:outer membrane lipoprotein SlyB